jgi:hypothetical protein
LLDQPVQVGNVPALALQFATKVLGSLTLAPQFPPELPRVFVRVRPTWTTTLRATTALLSALRRVQPTLALPLTLLPLTLLPLTLLPLPLTLTLLALALTLALLALFSLTLPLLPLLSLPLLAFPALLTLTLLAFPALLTLTLLAFPALLTLTLLTLAPLLALLSLLILQTALALLVLSIPHPVVDRRQSAHQVASLIERTLFVVSLGVVARCGLTRPVESR